MRYRTPLARVRGLGSAREGTRHFWMQRVTAVALVPLTLWLVISLVGVATADYATAVSWMRGPINTVLWLGLILATFYHALLGVQVVIEDYVHGEGRKLAALVFLKLVIALLGGLATLSVLRVAIGS